MAVESDGGQLDLWPSFVPATNKLEAVSRISALTQARPQELGPGSKERKSVLTDLAEGLGLDVDLSSTKPVLGSELARQLDEMWDETCWSAGQTITLTGLNRLLRGAQRRLERERVARAVTLPRVQSAGTFVPARSKLEVVSRISALTGSGPEELGPGSKERKSVLINLATGLGLPVQIAANKPKLGSQIADALGVPWGVGCWSAGHTITLEGLNRLLEGAETRLAGRHFGRLFADPVKEAEAILTAIASVMPRQMDGRACVLEMLAAEDRHWAQDEWIGFYFEFKALPACINAFAGGPVEHANTRFDYGLGETWDLKAHSSDTDDAPLNAIDATRACLAQGGLGFIVLSGVQTYDDGKFREWQKQLRRDQGKKAVTRAAPPRYQRRSKSGFIPLLLEAYYLPDTSALDSALIGGAVGILAQGRQVSGALRKPKYRLSFTKARNSGLCIARRSLPTG